MKTSMDNHGIGPIETFVDVGRQVIVRDKTFHQDANDAGFRRAVACVSPTPPYPPSNGALILYIESNHFSECGRRRLSIVQIDRH